MQRERNGSMGKIQVWVTRFFNRKVGATFFKMLQHRMTCNAHNIYMNCLHETIKTLKEGGKKKKKKKKPVWTETNYS